MNALCYSRSCVEIRGNEKYPSAEAHNSKSVFFGALLSCACFVGAPRVSQVSVLGPVTGAQEHGSGFT